MRPIATDVWRGLSVGQSVSLSVSLWCNGQVSYKNGWTDRDAVWHVGWGMGPSNHVLDGGPDPLGEVVILGDFVPIEQHCNCLLRSLAISVLHFGPHLLKSDRWLHRSYDRNAHPLNHPRFDSHLGAELFGDDAAFYRINSISCWSIVLIHSEI